MTGLSLVHPLYTPCAHGTVTVTLRQRLTMGLPDPDKNHRARQLVYLYWDMYVSKRDISFLQCRIIRH